MPTEFASGARSIASAYHSLAQWAGVPLEEVASYAERGALNELVEQRELAGPVRGSTALRHIEKLRRDPSKKSPAALVGELRAQRAVWEAQEAGLRTSDPIGRLAELYRRRDGWWS
jgi:hypothetical protein